MILTRKRLLVDIFFTRRLSKSLAFCEFASVNFEPCFKKTTSVPRLKGAMSREDIVVFSLVLCRSHYLVPLPTVHKIPGTLIQFWPLSLSVTQRRERGSLPPSIA